MYLFRSLSKKRATAQGFQSKTAPQKTQLQAFILEPILTPSGVVDSPDTPDLVVMDFDQLDTSGIDIDFDVDDTDLSALSVPELEIPDEDLEPVDFIYDVDTQDLGSESVPDVAVPNETLEPGGFIDNIAEQDLGVETPDGTVEPVGFIDDAGLALDLIPLTEPSPTFDSGVFTVGETGNVSVDFLFDGGKYQGEFAIFSLDGMDEFEPGSQAFIEEAARRGMSDSQLGYVVISDPIEGARFSSHLDENDWNEGAHQGVKTFSMRPGDEFGFMLVPNGTVQQVLDNPSAEGDLRPLFSMAMLNPNEAFHVGQLADVTGDGSTFVMEDLRVDRWTDKDYNDIIFQVHGATGKAVLLNDVIDPAHDWRTTELGSRIAANVISHVAPGKDLPGDPIHPALPAPTVLSTTVDQGGNGFSDLTGVLDEAVEPNQGGALPHTPTHVEASLTQDVIDQVGAIDPTDVYQVSSNQLVNTEISVLSGNASVSILTPEGEVLSQQVLSRGTHSLTLPENVSGEVLLKFDSQGGSDGTYILRGFESKAAEPFNIDVEFEGGLTTSQQEVIRAATKSVESLIGQGLPSAIVDGKIIDDVNFKISVSNLDGLGGTAARTQIDFMRYGTLLPAQSLTQFDAADIAELESSGQLFSVVQHEILHGLGFGNLWEAKGLVDYAGTPLAQYNGEQAVEAFKELGGLTDAIALEAEGDGSAGLHWHEELFQDELMTADLGFQTGGNGQVFSPISPVTLAALVDLGYQVNRNKSTPDWGLFGGQRFNPDDLTQEQVEALRQLAEEAETYQPENFIPAILPEVDPAKVSPEIWAHAERFWKNGEYYDWESYQVQEGDTFSDLALRYLGNAGYDYYKWIADHNGAANYDYLYWSDNDPSKNRIEVPRHHPNYEWEQEQERLRREEELRQRQEEEAQRQREEEERLRNDQAEQERKRREEEQRQREAEAHQRELEEQEQRLREEQERRRQQEEYEREQARLREVERQREIARQKGKGGQDWFFATPLPEFGPTDPFETRLTGETVGNLVPDDYYRFTLSRNGRVTAELVKLLADADLVLYDARDRPIAWSMREGITDEQIIADLIPGTYMLRVNSPGGVTTDYELIVQFQHLLSATQKGPPPGWQVGGGSSSGGSGGSGGVSGPTFADPRIHQIYTTALNEFAGAEQAKANAKIRDLEAEKRQYEQDLQTLLDQMNGEQRAKVHQALDNARDEANVWVDNIANPIKEKVDSLADGIISKAKSFASSLDDLANKIPDFPLGGLKDDAKRYIRQGLDAVTEAVNGARSWLKGKLTEIQDGVKSAIWHFFETLKNAYRTGAEINGIIESAAQTLKNKIDGAVQGANDLIGQFKGKVLSAARWTESLGININQFGINVNFNVYNSIVKPAVDTVADGFQSVIGGIGNTLKGAVDWVKPRAQTAVAAVVDAIFGDKTGHLYNKIHGVDAQIAATRTKLEEAIAKEANRLKDILHKADDLITSVVQSPQHVDDVLIEVWDYIQENWPAVLAITTGFIVAETIVGLLAAVPEPTLLTKVASVTLQGLIIAMIGTGVVVELGNALSEADKWWNLATTANGDREQIAAASRSFVRMIGHAALAIVGTKQFKSKLIQSYQSYFATYKLSISRRTHILDGDGPGQGGHGPGRGISGKSEFPSKWSDDQTINNIYDVLKDPNSIWTQQTGSPGAKYTRAGDPVRWKVQGNRDGIDIRIVVEPHGEGIITAFPTNVPPNP